MPSLKRSLLQTYVVLRKFSKNIPSQPIREETWKEIKQVYQQLYRENKLEELEKWSQSKLSFLQSTLPKRLWPKYSLQENSNAEATIRTTFVFRNGKFEKTTSSSTETFQRASLEPEDIRRHYQLLERMRFGKR
eukprot:jgi/Galph1/1208/GphlegSOOS_G6094.1